MLTHKRTLAVVLLASATGAQACVQTYIPQQELFYSPFERAVGEPRKVISKSFNPQNELTEWTETQFDGTRMTQTFYVLEEIIQKSVITAQYKDGRFVGVQHHLINGADFGFEVKGEAAKRALDTVLLSNPRVLRPSLKLAYDAQNRQTAVSVQVMSAFGLSTVNMTCQYIGDRQVIQSFNMLGVTGQAGPVSTRRVDLGDQKLILKETAWTDNQIGQAETTTYGARDSRGRVIYKTLNSQGSVIESGSIQLNAKGQTTSMTRQGRYNTESQWTYDNRGNWTERKIQQDGEVRRTIRTFTY